MPVAVPQLFQYAHVPETKENLDWADLPTIDLALYDTADGRKQLARTLIDAVRTKGFFYVINFPISQERVDRQFALGQTFYELPLEEKEKYVPDLDNGQYNGYRPSGRRLNAGGLKDQTEVYNIPKFSGHFRHHHPKPIADNIAEIEQFARDLHTHILDPLHVLFALALELPEDYFKSIHDYPSKSEDHLRYMKYSAYTLEQREHLLKTEPLYTQGHTDLGTITLLFRQPVAALQIKDHETGEWKWAKPLNASLTVNTCDALSYLTAGYVKSTIHRVHLPPKDQWHVDRLGLLYFARPHNDLVLNTIDSPVLKKAGFIENELERYAKEHGTKVPTMEEFTFAKQKWQQGGPRNVTYKERDGLEIMPGVKGALYA